jgi:hypothetical protein
MSAVRRIADFGTREEGSMIVFAAMLVPVVLFFLTLTVDVGNWWVHKRHLQLQVDAAALAGGALFGGCFTDSAAANTAIQDEANRFGGTGGSSYNAQVGGASAGTVNLAYQSVAYPDGTVDPDPTETQPPCDTPSLMFDVKASEQSLPLIFQIPGLPNITTINAHARVELKLVEIQEGMLPVAVPDLRFNYVFATFVDEATGSSLGTVELQRTGTSGEDQLWATPAGIAVPIASQHVGVRLRLVGGTDPNAACGQLFTECYDADSPNGVVHIRGWSTATAPTARNVWLLPGSCVPDAYFAKDDCNGGIQAEVDLGANYPLTGTDVTAKVWAEVDGDGPFPLTAGGTSGLVTWTSLAGLPLAGGGSHTVELRWSWKQTSGTWNGETCTSTGGNKCKAEGTFGPVQRGFVADAGRSGPLQRVQVFESGVTSSGSNSFQADGTTRMLGLSVAVRGSLKVQSEATDPIVELRVVGGRGPLTQSVDCDPAIVNIEQEIEQGCGPAYKINRSFTCPNHNDLWGTPQPWECVKTQTGGAVGQVDHGMGERILGGADTCAAAPNNWPNYAVGDPRIVPLLIVPFGAFGGTPPAAVPVIDFAAFYVTNWNGDPCQAMADWPDKGAIEGHFVKYAAPNPHGAGELVCNPDALTPCVPVLTR